MILEFLTALYFVFFFITNVMYFQICNTVLTECRFSKKVLYFVAFCNSCLFSFMVYNFNQLPTVTYLLVLFGSIIQLIVLFKNHLLGILMCSFMAIIYLVCIESIVISTGTLILNTTLANLTHNHLLLFSHIVISWFICMLVAISIHFFVPGRYLQIINQNKEQVLFVLGFLFLATVYLTLNSFIYANADTFNSIYLPIHQIISPLVWLLTVSLAVSLLIRFDYLHGYKVKSGLLQQTVDRQKSELLESKTRAERDSLMGIYNKSAVEEKIGDALKEIDEGTFYILDIDNFKNINDSKGHPFGDKVLVYLSKRLLHTFRQQDIVGRIGGDEFVIFQKYTMSEEQVAKRAQTLCNDMRVPFVDECGESVSVSISVGIALAPKHGKDFESLYQKADIALYQAKNMGKNTFSVYNET